MSLRNIAAQAANFATRRVPTLSMRPQPTVLGARSLSTEASTIKELPNDEPHDVVFESKYGLRSIMLNRPKKLNSLNGSMVRKIVPRLVEWEKSDMANVIVLKGAGGKALCAGGDVTSLAEYNQKGKDGWKKSLAYFGLEYKLDHYIATYNKPFITFMDGITMGGGVGLSINAPFRIATEKTVFAMPETTIGFFPDVGASFFLPRMNGSIGTYLALTSERLTGPNVFYSGLATHYLHSTSLPDLEARLAELRFKDHETLPERLALINDTLEEFCTGLPYDQPMLLGGELRQAVDRCFSKNNIADIISALKEERGSTEEWAQKQLASLEKRSPTAVHVTLRQMRLGGDWDIAEAFKNEYQMAGHFMQHPDFTEGVSALLVRKDKPKWNPPSLDAIPASENVAKPFFDFSQQPELKLFSDKTYMETPYPWLGVPNEAEVKKVAEGRKYTPTELANVLIASRKGRQGVAEIVREIISRKTSVDEAGKVKWVDGLGPVAGKL